jgi:hypothetical protein
MATSTDAVPTEHFEQCELVMWFRQTYFGVRVFAIPNGGQRSISTAARLKAEGVCAGVPDLFIPPKGLVGLENVVDFVAFIGEARDDAEEGVFICRLKYGWHCGKCSG